MGLPLPLPFLNGVFMIDWGLFCPGYCLKPSKFSLVLGHDLSVGFVDCLLFLGDGDLDLGWVGEGDLD